MHWTALGGTTSLRETVSSAGKPLSSLRFSDSIPRCWSGQAGSWICRVTQSLRRLVNETNGPGSSPSKLGFACKIDNSFLIKIALEIGG